METEPKPPTAKLITDEEVSEQVYKKITQLKGSDYWVIRIKKRTLLGVIGIMLVIMWLVVGGRYLWQGYGKRLGSSNNPVKTETSQGPHLRIRKTVPDEAGVKQMVAKLTEGGFTGVEVVEDYNSSVSGILVVIKPGNEPLRNQINGILQNDYPISSPSAELTSDSDIDAVIFYGKLN